MSYNIGQLRSTSISSYTTPVSIGAIETFDQSSDIPGDSSLFSDIQINIPSKLTSQKIYHFKFQVAQRLDSIQTINLRLRRGNSELSNDSYQTIKTFTVQQATQNPVFINFECIIAPNADYDYIILELERTLTDYQKDEVNSAAKGRVIQVSEVSLVQINNLISDLQRTYSNLKKLTKIGVQGRSGLLMCINREQIRIGKSGVYEINNGMKIDSLGFIPQPNDFFLVDFEY